MYCSLWFKNKNNVLTLVHTCVIIYDLNGIHIFKRALVFLKDGKDVQQ